MGLSTLHIVVALGVLGCMASGQVTLTVSGTGCAAVTTAGHTDTSKCTLGTSVTLECSTVARAAKYKIMKAGTDAPIFEDATTRTTSITTYSRDNEGSYTCVVEVTGGDEQTSDVEKIVTTNPTLTVSGGCTLVDGTTDTYTCAQTADDVILACKGNLDTTQFQIKKGTTTVKAKGTESTFPVPYSDTAPRKGDYTCDGFDGSGGASAAGTSNTIKLEDNPPTLTVTGCSGANDGTTVNCLPDDTVTLTCGDVKASLYKIKKGTTNLLSSATDRSVVKGYKTDLGEDDYKCEATFNGTPKDSKIIKLVDASSLTVSGCSGADTNDVNSFNCKPEDEVTLTCGTVTGATKYEILKNGNERKPVASGDTITDVTKSLKYKDANLGKGDYTCKATVTATDKRVSSPVKRLIDDPPRSGSTNVQMSYLMLGLVTLMSAVWSGRVC